MRIQLMYAAVVQVIIRLSHSPLQIIIIFILWLWLSVVYWKSNIISLWNFLSFAMLFFLESSFSFTERLQEMKMRIQLMYAAVVQVSKLV